MSQRLRQVVTVLLAILGVEFWLNIFRGFWDRNIHLELLVAAIILPLIPGVAAAAWFVLKRLHRPTPLARCVTMLLVTIGAAAILARFAITSGRDLFPVWHDEYQFLLQTRMLSVGRLWMPGHPLYDFFDTFYVLIQPKYAAQSFPGTAFLFVPAIWLHIQPWKWAILLAAITVGLFYRVVTEFAGGLPGLLAAALLVKLSIFRYLSTMVLAQMPVTLLGLATIWAYQRWRRNYTARSAALLGFLGGFTFITRPADALVFGIPIGVAILLDVRRRVTNISPFPGTPGEGWGGGKAHQQKDPHPNPPPAYQGRGKSSSIAHAITLMIPTLAGGFAGAFPWIAIILAFDRGVTGHWLTTPFDFYNQRDQPGLVYGLRAQNPGNPLTKIPEKRGYYLGGVVYRIKEHRPDQLWHSFVSERLPATVPNCLTQPMMGALMPIGLLLWLRRRAWVLAIGLPMFFILYTPYPIFIQHYVLVAAPAEIFGAILGISAIARAWPRHKARIWTAAFIFVTGVMFTSSSEIMPMTDAMVFHNDLLRTANATVAALTAKGQPAVVLFKRDESIPADFEPVYNIDTAWPEDATVIRAHDLGDEDQQIFQYYATHGPDRAFYRFDESRLDEPLTFLGMGSELANIKVGQKMSG